MLSKLDNVFMFLCLVFSDTFFFLLFLQFISLTKLADSCVCYDRFP